MTYIEYCNLRRNLHARIVKTVTIRTGRTEAPDEVKIVIISLETIVDLLRIAAIVSQAKIIGLFAFNYIIMKET